MTSTEPQKQLLYWFLLWSTPTQFWSCHLIATRCNHDEMGGCKANLNPNIENNTAISYSESLRFCFPRGPA